MKTTAGATISEGDLAVVDREDSAVGDGNTVIEQRHHRLKRAVEQALILRGSRDFNSVDD